MDERQELVEAMDDISRALDDMGGAVESLRGFLERHREDRYLDVEDSKGARYRQIEAIYEGVTCAMNYEDEVGILCDDLSEEGGR
ncbi:MAG: hypothetical protein LBK67_08870 [Coriobacteriales bacterium]|jgi:tricorn protease-like protein|nr:hypothetical protein [Coriobacteriales bacterium]